MKILHVCRQYAPSIGGAERFAAALAQRLAARGHKVEVATLNRRWRHKGTLPAHAVIDGIDVHRLWYVGSPLYFLAPGVLPLASRFDVVHVHHTDFFLDFLAVTRRLHRRPLVVSTHGGYFHTGQAAQIKRLYFDWITRHSLRSAAVVVPNSPSDERRFAPHARRAARIDNAIDARWFAAARRDPVPGRCVTVGRLAPNKNLAGVLEAFAQASAMRPHLTLTVVGGGELRPLLQAQANDLGIGGRVRWAGELSDEEVRLELARAEFFLSGARHEAFGLALLEAMAAGVIPIVNRIEAFADVIENGRNGVLCHYQPPDAAAQALGSAADLPAADKAQLAARAQQSAMRFDWEGVTEKFEQVYEMALERK